VGCAPHLLSLSRVEGSPVKPSSRFCRAVLAQIFNRDNWQDDVTWAEATVIMGAKLLKDAGHEDDHITSIFRFFRDSIVDWTKQIEESPCDAWNLLILAIMDNRRALLLGAPHDQSVFDFREGVETTKLPVPIFQVSVTLSGLLSLIVDPVQSDRSVHEAVEATEAALPDRPVDP